jgi:hypothetical protein
MYLLAVALLCCGGFLFMQFLKRQGADFSGLDPTLIPLYDFPDVWQNSAYLGSFCKIILGFIIVISVANDDNYRTLRQNIIDGLSKSEFWLSKLIHILVLSTTATVFLFILGLLMGGLYSNVEGYPHIFHSLDFILAYFLVLLTYLAFCFWIALLIPRVGLVIVGLFLYTIMFEPIFGLFLENFPHVYDTIRSSVSFLPVRSLYNLIPVPFPKYFLREFQEYVGFRETLIVLGWLMINLGLSYFILKKKDW